MRLCSATSLLIIFLGTTVFTGMLLCYWLLRSSSLDCVGDADWNINVVRFAGTVSFQMHNNEGLVMLTGKLDDKLDVNRLVYFNYTKRFRTRILHTVRVVKAFSDNVDDKEFINMVPGFYLESGGELSLVVDEYKHAYVFSNSNVPYLYCRKK